MSLHTDDIRAALAELGLDAGLAIAKDEAFSEKTRKRAYWPRVEKAFRAIPEDSRDDWFARLARLLLDRVVDSPTAPSSNDSFQDRSARLPVEEPRKSLQEKEESQQADVFISHATEDKPYVEPLVKALQTAGVRVWYDRATLEWGDELRTSIDRGLASCRFGIVVFSKAFLGQKKWTEYELNALFAREKANKKVILPIWHGVTHDDLLLYSPAFADRLAKISSSDDYNSIVSALLKMLDRSAPAPSINPPLHDPQVPKSRKRSEALAYAIYELKGSSSRVAIYVRGTEHEGTFVLENSQAEDEFGTKQEIALRFASLNKSLLVNGYVRMNYGNSGDTTFDL